ncbi:MgtC/SapB family protein [Lacrimispora brassicae]
MESGEIFESINLVSVLTRLTLAVILGGILGFERGRKRRPAGLRTYMIVCLASALVMITGEFLTERYQAGDPARLGVQVISGIKGVKYLEELEYM